MAKRRNFVVSGSLKRRFARRLMSLLILGALTIFGFLLMQGRVISVSDGDTLVVLTGKGEREKVRLYGIDCPEMGQAHGQAAKDFTSSLALLHEVKVTRISKDQYGRSVALVTLPDGRSLNAELVADGHAMVYWRYCAIPQCVAWQVLEKEARRKRLGMWKEKNPEAPWNWRKRQNRARQEAEISFVH